MSTAVARGRKAIDPGRGLTEEYVSARGRSFRTVRAGAGPLTVVFESGLAAAASVWVDVQRRVAAHTATLSYDRAGIGGSDPATDGRLLTDIAADLEAVLDAADVTGPILIVGHSWGGPIVRTFVTSTTRQLAGIVLVEGTLSNVIDAEGGRGLLAYFRLAKGLSRVRLHRPLRHLLLKNTAFGLSDADAALVRRDMYAARAMRAGEQESRGLVVEVGRLPDLEAQGFPDAVPVLMIWGTVVEPKATELRPKFNAAAQAEAEAVGGRLVSAEGCRHDVHQQRPDLVADEIIALVRGA
jgi:pimeloyl-ACP methyl ester carboxylesterase